MSKLITLAIPTYNRADFLRELLESCDKNLTTSLREKIEIIVPDNCSPDHTQEVVKSFADKLTLKYLRNEKNVGFDGNFMLLLKKTETEYIWYIGDDDLVTDKLELLEDILAKDFDMIFVNYQISRYYESKTKYFLNDLNEKTFSDKTLFAKFVGFGFGYFGGVIYKTKLINSISTEKYYKHYSAGNSIHTYLYINALNEIQKSHYLPIPLIIQRMPDPSTLPYDGIQYSIEFYKMVSECAGNRKISESIINRHLKGVLFRAIIKAKIFSVSQLSKYDFSVVKKYFCYWIYIFPSLLIPGWFFRFLFKVFIKHK